MCQRRNRGPRMFQTQETGRTSLDSVNHAPGMQWKSHWHPWCWRRACPKKELSLCIACPVAAFVDKLLQAAGNQLDPDPPLMRPRATARKVPKVQTPIKQKKNLNCADSNNRQPLPCLAWMAQLGRPQKKTCHPKSITNHHQYLTALGTYLLEAMWPSMTARTFLRILPAPGPRRAFQCQ